jgi:sensor domain CHASE-containing protein
LLSALGVALGAWLGVQAVCLGLLRPVFLESYARIEANEARRDLARAAAAIEQLEARMVGSGRDWADWSAAYAYLRGTNPGFIRENLNPLHMDSMQLDVMLFTDPSGAAVHAEGYETAGG